MDSIQHYHVQTQHETQSRGRDQFDIQLAQSGAPQVIRISKSWHVTKLTLYSISVVFCITVLGISIALVVDPTIYQGYQIIWIAPQAAVALCWDAAELITICSRQRGRGIHPGAHVALHLLLWLGFCAAIGLTAWLVAFAAECDYYCRYFGTGNGLHYSRYATILDAELAVLTFLAIVHFSLFARACVETYQRNKFNHSVAIVPQKMDDYRRLAQSPGQHVPLSQQ